MNKYAIVRVGGSIGDSAFTTIGIYDTKEDAQSEVKFRKSRLSDCEKKYYGIKYKVIALTPRNVELYKIEF